MARLTQAESVSQLNQALNTTPDLVANTYRLMSSLSIPTDWGVIMKGELITKALRNDVAMLREMFGLDQNMTHSVAIGAMAPGAFHEPFIRHSNPDVVYDPKNMRIYRIIAGSFTCTRVTQYGRKLLTATPTKGYLAINDLDIFSFKAGPQGCVFAIIDFPEFDLTQDVNNINSHN